ncbi:Transcriptional regulator, AraC family [Flavobacterium sp. 9AF]|uniref:helix-turn-helix domain-containing protein n=1 Tax=Flavobacterium sp. 9AF TaxID=2653142 RepID=UPI0012F08317|nr:helix-turn-helix domain-containing protein [Flavobacterium sp. 9AF]VXB69845.1 Transcriptional regulator, AraC family [Flavobacterium sp. 9AF]
MLDTALVSLHKTESITDFNPKRVKKYALIWCQEGNLTLEVDHKMLTLSQNQVVTITSGQYHAFKNTKNSKGYLLQFTLDYICKTEKDIELIFQNSLFCHFDYNEIISCTNKTEIEEQFLKIENELRCKPYQYLEAIHARIELLLFTVNRAKIENGGEIWKPEALFLRFLEFVRNHFKKNYTLKEIAKQLQTTELKLNELAKLHAGKTAQNVLFGLVISEAKRKLHYENKSIKEIAYELGFKDPYYFSKFFKNHTQISPTDYLKEKSM